MLTYALIKVELLPSTRCLKPTLVAVLRNLSVITIKEINGYSYHLKHDYFQIVSRTSEVIVI